VRLSSSLSLIVVLGLSVGCSKAPAEPERDTPLPAPVSALDHAAVPPDAERSASGLASKVLEPGTGDERPTLRDKVRLHFTAWNTKGEVSDSSDKRGGPVVFEVTGVIAGWTEALQQMRVGERRRLWIPDHLTYPGRPGYPRPAALFELELLEIIEDQSVRPAPADVAAAPADATITSSGLAYKLLHESGGDDKPNAWDRVAIHYAGWRADGAWIDSSHRERASLFDLGSVMPGWSEALQRLSVGDKARVWVPEALAYQGRVGEPQGPLVFELELVSIERRPAPPRPPTPLAAPPASAKRTPSGLAYRMLAQNTAGARAKPSDRVELQYSAWTSDGKLFDSSIARGKPTTVPVSRVIPGWAEGLQLMGEGDKAVFWIPEKLAYAGREGSPRGMLVYEVELLKITP